MSDEIYHFDNTDSFMEQCTRQIEMTTDPDKQAYFFAVKVLMPTITTIALESTERDQVNNFLNVAPQILSFFALNLFNLGIDEDSDEEFLRDSVSDFTQAFLTNFNSDIGSYIDAKKELANAKNS